MHRSSDSIAYLAAALAKAQGELTNPEKSLTATIRGSRAGEGERASATPHCPVGSISCARRSASTRSPPYRQPRSTRLPAPSI